MLETQDIYEAVQDGNEESYVYFWLNATCSGSITLEYSYLTSDRESKYDYFFYEMTYEDPSNVTNVDPGNQAPQPNGAIDANTPTTGYLSFNVNESQNVVFGMYTEDSAEGSAVTNITFGSGNPFFCTTYIEGTAGTAVANYDGTFTVTSPTNTHSETYYNYFWIQNSPSVGCSGTAAFDYSYKTTDQLSNSAYDPVFYQVVDTPPYNPSYLNMTLAGTVPATPVTAAAGTVTGTGVVPNIGPSQYLVIGIVSYCNPNTIYNGHPACYVSGQATASMQLHDPLVTCFVPTDMPTKV